MSRRQEWTARAKGVTLWQNWKVGKLFFRRNGVPSEGGAFLISCWEVQCIVGKIYRGTARYESPLVIHHLAQQTEESRTSFLGKVCTRSLKIGVHFNNNRFHPRRGQLDVLTIKTSSLLLWHWFLFFCPSHNHLNWFDFMWSHGIN